MSGIDWRDSLRGPANKERYIREVLNIDAPKSSKEYRNTYRYLALVEKGQRGGTKRYIPVIEQATREAVQRAETRDREAFQQVPEAGGAYSLGQTVTETARWEMHYQGGREIERRRVTATVTLDTPQKVADANERGIVWVVMNEYYSDGEYYADDYDTEAAWWHSYAET